MFIKTRDSLLWADNNDKYATKWLQRGYATDGWINQFAIRLIASSVGVALVVALSDLTFQDNAVLWLAIALLPMNIILYPIILHAQRRRVEKLKEEGRVVRLPRNFQEMAEQFLGRAFSPEQKRQFGSLKDSHLEFLMRAFPADVQFFVEACERYDLLHTSDESRVNMARGIHQHFMPIIPQLLSGKRVDDVIAQTEGNDTFLRLHGTTPEQHDE